MKASNWLMLFLLANKFVYSQAPAGNGFPWVPEAVERMKNRVGFYDIPSAMKMVPIQGDDVVIYRLPDLEKYLRRYGSWTLISSYVNLSYETLNAEYLFGQGDDKISNKIRVKYVITHKGVDDILSSYFTTICEGPWSMSYVRGPRDLGGFSMVLPISPASIRGYREVIFTIKNAGIWIERFPNTKIDTIAMARWIQSNIKLRPWREVLKELPRPKRAVIEKDIVHAEQDLLFSIKKPLQGKVDVPMVIRVVLPEDKNYILKDHGDDFYSLARQGQGNIKITITPFRVGTGYFKYSLIDKDTLLFSTTEIPIEVR